MEEKWNDSTKILIGDEAIKKLENSKVAVYGIGGVGSFTVEALARAGIGHLVLIDNDLISITNLNRQIHANINTIGQKKVEVMKQRILEINPNYILGNLLGAKTAMLKEDYDLAKGYAQEAISLDINCAEGYYYLALVREKTEDLEEAIECMKRAILYDLNNPRYYTKMSEFYKSKKDYKTALEYIAEAESIDDSNEYKILYSELVKLNRKSK